MPDRLNDDLTKDEKLVLEAVAAVQRPHVAYLSSIAYQLRWYLVLSGRPRTGNYHTSGPRRHTLDSLSS